MSAEKNMNESILRRSTEKRVRRYLLSDVVSCTFTFADGLSSKMTTSPSGEVVLVKMIPKTTETQSFQDRVIQNYTSANKATELAELCGYDCMKTFTRHFKKSFGQTPYQWMLEHKLDEVSDLIVNSNMTIADIAKMYGFKNSAHFSNLYKKHFGISPLQYRLKKQTE